MRRARRIAFALLALALSGDPALAERHEGPGGLTARQMTRSLQLLQDRIAGGDHAAIAMQRPLLEMIDDRLRALGPDGLSEEKNVTALLIYAMSGGNPDTLDLLASRFPGEPPYPGLFAALKAYLSGDVAAATDGLEAVAHGDLPDELAASVALIKGSVLAASNGEAALDSLEEAIVMAPGTLVEEAALRRSMLAAIDIDDAEAFTFAASRYARRFVRSPYATQFADAFVDGIGRFHAGLDAALFRDLLGWMSAEQGKAVVMRLTRRAAIENDDALLSFIDALRSRDVAGDPRAQLYSSLGSVAAEDPQDVLETLAAIDPAELSDTDRALLKAAKSVVRAVVAPAAATGAPLVPVTTEPDTADAQPKAQAPAVDATESLIETTREKLGAIDALLEGSEP